MGLCLRLTLPVLVLALFGLTVSWPAGLDLTGVPVAVLCLVCVGISLGQALRIRAVLEDLPAAIRATVWGKSGAEFPTLTGDDELVRFTGEMRDLSLSMQEVFRQRSEMEQMAHTDPLTNLPNRRALNALLSKLANDHGDGPGGIGILHLDLDHFKVVNDRFGHEAGDHVLREATRLISLAIRDSDFLARLGGDEFAIIAPGVDTENVLVRIAERVIEMFADPISYDDQICNVGISIGMVLGGMRGKVLDPQRLLLNADIALCRAKAEGRNRHAMFSSSMARANRRQQNQADEMRKALDHDQFRAWFQPVVDLKTGSTCAFQVIPRWESTAHGFVAPQEFLRTAETFNLVEELGMRVFEHACKCLAEWRRENEHVPGLQICMSRAQLLDASVADRVSWCLDDVGLAPEDVSIAVAEQNLSDRSSEVVIANLLRLRDLGCAVTLDDFGTENGAFLHIASLRPNRIVVTPRLTEFLAHEGQTTGATALLKAVVGGATALGCSLAAKDITQSEQIDILKNLGVVQASGSLWGQPMNAASLATVVAESHLQPTQIAQAG